jgi:hypothetical protein
MLVMTERVAFAMAAVLALLSIAGCAQYYGQEFVGKGKAPPPVVTKG